MLVINGKINVGEETGTNPDLIPYNV